MFPCLGVAPMVQDAKQVAMDTNNPAACSRWRDSNRGVSLTVFALYLRHVLIPLTQRYVTEAVLQIFLSY